MKNLYHYLRIAIAIGGLTQIAQALPSLKFFDGTTTLIVTDNMVGDGSGTAGRVVWDGVIGNWTLNTHIGTGFPAIGTLGSPEVDLTFNAVSNGSGGTLLVSFSVDGLGPTSSPAFSSIGGTSQGIVSTSVFGGTDNTLFSEANLLGAQGPFTGAYSGAIAGGMVDSAGPYALTQQVSITHQGAGMSTGNARVITDGNASVTSVPESGTTVLLLGAGLMGLGFVARLRPRSV